MSANSHDSDEMQLCISCLSSNFPDAHFCEKCGAPLDFYSATAPLERIHAQGFAFRSAVIGRPRLVVVIGMWILFMPGVLVFILRSGILLLDRRQPSYEDLISFLYAVFGVLITYRVTKNYMTIPPIKLDDGEQDAGQPATTPHVGD